MQEIFDKDLPYFLSIGMTYEQYWYGPSLLAKDYLQAETYRRKSENYNLWLGGLYISHAIASTIGNAFIKEKSNPNVYPDKPFPVTKEEMEDMEREQHEKEVELARLKIQMLFDRGKDFKTA